ncbi:MAG: glycosyltransferase family 2 protein [Oscillospiraceae bacterium]
MIFSIIIPVYNAKEYLDVCVRSVLEQTFQDFELFLVDDGSTDGSGHLCDCYAQTHTDHVHVLHKKNGGAGDARNAALPMVQGEYIVFLDCDDTLELDALEQLSAQIVQTHADVYYFGMRITDGLRTLAVFSDTLPFGEPLTLAGTPALLLNRPSACTAIWKRTLFESTDIRFRAKGWGEDLCMTRKMLSAASSVVVLPEIYYNYLQHSGSVTSRDQLNTNREIIDALQDLFDWYQTHGLFETYRDELCKLCIDNVLYDASVRILKAIPKHPLLKEFRDFTTRYFPDYRTNKYLSSDPAKKKIVFSLLSRQQYRAVYLLFRAANHKNV